MANVIEAVFRDHDPIITIDLTEGDDFWSGQLFFDDGVHGLGGDDQMFGAGGNDNLWGGDGDDRIRGDDGDDALFGDSGADTESGSGHDDLRGGAGNDVLYGGRGNDNLEGGNDDDELHGQSGHDTLDGGRGADDLFGGSGFDELFSISAETSGIPLIAVESLSDVSRSDGGGILDGGEDNDTIMTSHDFSGVMTIIGGSGTDTLTFGRDRNVWTGPAPIDNVVDLLAQNGTTVFGGSLVVREIENVDGDGYDDVFRGDHGANVLRGFGGDDVLQGRGGADTLDGGSGRDRADYSFSLDVDVDLTRATQVGNHAEGDVLISIEEVDGSSFDDTLRGDGGANYLFGNGRNDLLEGRGGADTLNGGAGIDRASYESSTAGVMVALDDPTFAAGSFAAGGHAEGDVLISIENLTGSSHDDLLTGNSAANRVQGGGGGDEIYGLDGDDTLSGEAGNDTLVGGEHNDVIDGGFGNDNLAGESGIDTVSFESWDPTGLYSPALESIRIVLDQGSVAGTATRTVTNSVTRITSLAETDTLSGFENVLGSNRAETIVGNSGDNVLKGRGGNDVLQGNGGSDTLDGGAGNDTYMVDNPGDVIREFAGEGFDWVYASRSYTLTAGASVEAMETTNAAATFATNLTGNGADTWIRGNNGNNVLDGGAGQDELTGLAGDDTFFVDNAGDLVHDDAGQGFDRVFASSSFELRGNAEIEAMETTNAAGTAAINLTGNGANTWIRGNNGNNILNGGAGRDELIGLAGDDTYIVDNDVIQEAAGQGFDWVYATTSYTLRGNVEIEAMETIEASGIAAINLTGNGSNTWIRGNNGNNVLNGRAGADELIGLDGQDSFRFDTALGANNVDILSDFNVVDDTIQLDDAIFSSSLGLGEISATEFVTGAAATDANDRIIYNNNTGALLYDSDGTGASAAIQFAQLQSGLALTHLDFLVV